MRRVSLLPALLALCGWTSMAAAQDGDPLAALVGRPVAAVRVEVEDRVDTSPAIVSLVDVHEGAPLDLTSLRSSVQHLSSAGRFEDVVVTAVDGPSGVTVVFKATPRHPIDHVDYVDDTGLSRGDLEQRVKQQLGGYQATLRAPRLIEAVKAVLADEGYFNAEATADPPMLFHDPDRTNLTVHVKAGVRATIASVNLDNNSPLSNPEILARTGLEKGMPYRQAAVASNLSKLRDQLRSDRYYLARAPLPVKQLSADGTTVNVDLRVDAGPRVRKPVFDKDPPPEGADLNDLIPIERENSADEDLLDDSDVRLRQALQRQGFKDAIVSHSTAREGPDLIVTFHITRGVRYVVDRVEIVGNTALAHDYALQKLGMAAGAPYSKEQLDSGCGQILSEYLDRGYYLAKVDPKPEDRLDANGGHVAVTVVVTPGPEATIANVVVQPSTTRVPADDLRAAMKSKKDAPYVKRDLAGDQLTLETLYLDRGFLAATVTVEPKESADHRSVTLVVTANEGPQLIISSIRIVGNRRVSDRVIRSAMTIAEGQPYGASAVLESRQKIAAIVGIRSAQITIEPLAPGETRTHVVVTVEESPTTTIAYGFGVAGGKHQRFQFAPDGVTVESVYRVEFAPRGFFEVTRQNVAGRNATVDFFSRVSIRPKDAPDDPAQDGRGIGFSEYRVSGTYRERRAFHRDIDLLIGGTSEQVVQSEFNYLRQSVNADAVEHWGGSFSASARYALEFTKLFDQRFPPNEQIQVLRQLPQVRLSSVGSGLLWDRRNDPVAPWRGTLATADIQLAARALGSQVGFVKTLLTGAGFHGLGGSRRFVLAARAELGLAHGFTSEDLIDPVTLQPIPDPQNPGQNLRVASLPLSERFFAGGSTTVRGFDQDVLGVPNVNVDSFGLSLGGNGLVVLNGELRTRIFKLKGRDVGAVVFVDGGNVFARAADVDLGKLRGAAGFGFRYDSPLGPLRFDYGFKFSRQTIAGTLEKPRAWYISLGEAF